MNWLDKVKQALEFTANKVVENNNLLAFRMQSRSTTNGYSAYMNVDVATDIQKTLIDIYILYTAIFNAQGVDENDLTPVMDRAGIEWNEEDEKQRLEDWTNFSIDSLHNAPCAEFKRLFEQIKFRE